MNRLAMPAHVVRRKGLIFAACLAFAIAACGKSASPISEVPLAGAAIGGPFELVDAHGKTVRWSEFDGRYRMIYFGYTYCPDVCPLDVQRMMAGYAQFKEREPALAAQIQPLFVTIDPARDKPAVVGEFASAFSPDLIGLTGSAEQIDQAAKAFKVYYNKGPAGAGGGYMMDHSRTAYLMGRKGEPIALLPVDLGAVAVAEELARWVR
jgi:protein SCO1/2